MNKINGIDINTDDKFVVLQLNQDGGDALARTGNVYQLIGMATKDKSTQEFARLQAEFSIALDSLESPLTSGDYVRYSAPPYNDPDDMSRDNKMQAVMAMGAMGLPGYVASAFKADVQRCLRTPNGDILGPMELGMYLRSMWASISDTSCLNSKLKLFFILSRVAFVLPYLLLIVADLAQVINNLIIVLLKGREPGKIRKFLANKLGMFFLVQDYPKSVNPTNPDAWSVHGKRNVGDDVMAKRNMSLSKRYLPTPISWLARKLYVWLRPVYEGVPYNMIDPASNTVTKLRDCEATVAQYSDDVYYMPSSYANPINELYRDLNKEDFS